MKKYLGLLLLGSLALASCAPTVGSPAEPPPPATAPAPTPPAPTPPPPAAPDPDALRYSVVPGSPVAVSVSAKRTVAVSRAPGVSSVTIRFSANRELSYTLNADTPTMLFRPAAGLVGEYLSGEAWLPFLQIDKP